MEFLDSLDFEAFTHVKKTDRMRSWYLYEQYKTLEDHQLDAAQTLRNRSLQERLLQRELAERRARRNLYDQISFTRSEPKIGHSQATCLSTTADDFSENFCELHDFEAHSLNHSPRGSETYIDDCKTIDESREDTSCAGSVISSVVDLDKETTNMSAQRTIAENIKQHLQTVKKNMASLEKYARMGDDMSDDSVDSLGWPKPNNVLSKDVGDNQLFCVWSRLVAFAYHIIQLNHGNCYYDYSSQLLTAVLACDVLRRGLNRMCDILQYYVSPIKFADSEDGLTVCEKNKKKSYDASKKMRKTSKYELNSSLHKKCVTKRCEGNCKSDGPWQQHRKCSVINRIEENKKSLPRIRKWPRVERTSFSRSTLWTEELAYRFHRSRVNPMLRLVQCLDDVLKLNVQWCTGAEPRCMPETM